MRSFTGRTKKAAPIPMRWDLRNSSGRALLPAAYTLRMSGTAKDGSIVLPVYAKILITPAAGGAWGPCANVTRLAGGDAAVTSVLWGRVSAPASRTVVLTAPADEGEAALAAGVVAGPLARHLRSPLLLTRKAGLAPAVATDLRARRATRVIIVGSTSVVPQAVARAVQRLGVTVTRLSGSSAAATAVAVAKRFAPGTPAVLVSPSSPAHSLAGAALAATRNNPVLLAGSTSISKATRKALASRRTVTVAAMPSLTSATVRAALPARATWTRLTGPDATTASTAIATAVPGTVQRVVVLPDGTAAWGGAPLAAASGVPLLFTGTASLPVGVGRYLDARRGLRGALTPVGRDRLSDGVLGATSRLLSGQPWAPNPTNRAELQARSRECEAGAGEEGVNADREGEGQGGRRVRWMAQGAEGHPCRAAVPRRRFVDISHRDQHAAHDLREGLGEGQGHRDRTLAVPCRGRRVEVGPGEGALVSPG